VLRSLLASVAAEIASSASFGPSSVANPTCEAFLRVGTATFPINESVYGPQYGHGVAVEFADETALLLE